MIFPEIAALYTIENRPGCCPEMWKSPFRQIGVFTLDIFTSNICPGALLQSLTVKLLSLIFGRGAWKKNYILFVINNIYNNNNGMWQWTFHDSKRWLFLYTVFRPNWNWNGSVCGGRKTEDPGVEPGPQRLGACAFTTAPSLCRECCNFLTRFDEGLTLEMSALKILTVANLCY